MATREELVAAISSVDGLKGVPFFPPEMFELLGWPEITSVDAGPGWSYDVSWNVVVALANDTTTCQKQFDRLWQPLAEALRTVAYPENITLGLMAVGTEPRPIMTITLRSE